MTRVTGFVQANEACVSSRLVWKTYSNKFALFDQWLITFVKFIQCKYLSKHHLAIIFLLLQREVNQSLTQFRIPFSSLTVLYSISLLKTDWIFTSAPRENIVWKLWWNLEKEHLSPKRKVAAYWKTVVVSLSDLVKQLLSIKCFL